MRAAICRDGLFVDLVSDSQCGQSRCCSQKDFIQQFAKQNGVRSMKKVEWSGENCNDSSTTHTVYYTVSS